MSTSMPSPPAPRANSAGEDTLRLAAYQALPGLHDELRDAEGAVRPHWQPFIGAVQALGSAELAQRRALAQRLLQENGVTYNVYGDPRGVDRPWAFDPLPLILSAEEWIRIEEGLRQRACLLNLILADLYGPQRLIHEGVLPPEFVFANPKYLRPCHGAPTPPGGMISLLATDLARGPDGRWYALSDWSQAPSGAGYALENRIVMSRVFPRIIRDCRVERLAHFFDRLRNALQAMAPHNRDQPNIVVLTPGPYNETYFEHVYLARYLGFTLVEGEDLTVRDNRVYLKTLEGLRQVDVILRRVDDDFCDPLDLRADSALGVAGLVQAVNSGNVAVANALGCGLIECQALAAHLPRLCRHFLQQDLKLPTLPALWGADPEQLAALEAGLGDHAVGLAFANVPPPRRPEAPSPESLAALRAQILARPHAFVGRPPTTLSTVPVLNCEGLEHRHLVLRAYTLATDRTQQHVLPGGLSRFASSHVVAELSMQQGSGSKDTWICAEQPVSPYSLLPAQGHTLVLRRVSNDLPSRTADNLYWLGRYAERLEGTARILRYLLGRLTDESPLLDEAAFLRVMNAMPSLILDETHRAAPGRILPKAIEGNLHAAVYDPDEPHSVVWTLRALQRVAWVVRDRLSQDNWRIINGLGQGLTEGAVRDHEPGETLGALNLLITGLAACSGLANENMTRGPGWRLLDMGRRVERAFSTVQLIDATLREPAHPEEAVLQTALEIFDSGMTYRARYGVTLDPAAVIDLLVCDEGNPRAVAHQMLALRTHLEHLPALDAGAGLTPEARLALRMHTEVSLADAQRLAEVDEAHGRAQLAELLGVLDACLPRFSDALARRYFSHTAPSRQIERRTPDMRP
jgi:uncharacterized circularly permuted ATP-grasp superfamily protein/uncharacterized alpha-E superfamily protein